MDIINQAGFNFIDKISLINKRSFSDKALSVSNAPC